MSDSPHLLSKMAMFVCPTAPPSFKDGYVCIHILIQNVTLSVAENLKFLWVHNITFNMNMLFMYKVVWYITSCVHIGGGRHSLFLPSFIISRIITDVACSSWGFFYCTGFLNFCQFYFICSNPHSKKMCLLTLKKLFFSYVTVY